MEEKEIKKISAGKIVFNIISTLVMIACIGAAVYFVRLYLQKSEEARKEEETTTVTVESHLQKAHEFEAAGEYGKAVSAYRLYLSSGGTLDMLGYNDLAQAYLQLNMQKDYEKTMDLIFEMSLEKELTDAEYKLVEPIYYEIADSYAAKDYLRAYVYLTTEVPYASLYENYDKKELITPVAHPIAENGWQEDGTLFFGTYPVTEVAGQDVSEYIVNASYDERNRMELYGTTYYREMIEDAYHYFIVGNLQWKVVGEENGAKLLQTVKIIDTSKYHEEFVNVGWPECSLRTYMNGSFIAQAFSAEEAAHLITAMNNTVGNPTYKLIKDGGSCEDTAFILGLEQLYARYNKDYHAYMKEHFADYAAQVTEYAVTKGAYADADNYGKWWIRTMGVTADRKMVAAQTGTITTDGLDVTYEGIGIRAAIRIPANLWQ